MFAVDSFIDTVQGAKKYFVNTFVTDKEMQKPLNAFSTDEMLSSERKRR
jgi:hypothetical protein